MLGGDVSKITWEQFKESFYAKFFSTNVKYAKKQEFLNLEQGDMTVKQYDVEFDMLSRVAPEVVKDEDARIEKFVRDCRSRVNPGQKRKIEQQPADITLRDSSSGGTVRRHQQEVTKVGGTSRDLPTCRVCGRNHSGRCLAGKRICFKCKQEGHLANKCPQGVAATNLQRVEKATHK
ncbi:gag-protease polyprotein [Cucumis melo var. makuwa]|uniref:Gag-protease polyprotein n=1 Tax=Cucumis melo var. makuwa TaxID=1194695 RepID=A0A5A7SQM9_CUCMM|nr:gag-protease polyprotein [Cucumis melo var. makuwa]TYJ98745.1 gag-protease polyprotein [Cucumis melo var. makuwa]